MNKVCIARLVSEASSTLKRTPVFLTRASCNFLVRESLDSAIADLKETQKILENAKLLYILGTTTTVVVPPITTSPSSS